MRTDHNPLRFQPAPYKFRDVVFVVVTHLPCQDDTGYHKERMEVIQTCLTTMRGGAHREHTFLVWDNGSNSTFRDWLQHIFEPDILIQSHNIGKNLARACAVHMLPLGSIVCYSDDDMYYYDNWLSPQIELLNHFPGVSVVSGDPIRTMMRWGNENTIAWAKENAKIEQGRFIPKEWEMDYADSIGRSHKEQIEFTLKDVDYRITYGGKQAYATAHHAQFVGYTVKVRSVIDANTEGAMPDEKILDIAFDRIGLRISTTERLCRHIGNVLDDSFKNDKEKHEELIQG